MTSQRLHHAVFFLYFEVIFLEYQTESSGIPPVAFRFLPKNIGFFKVFCSKAIICKGSVIPNRQFPTTLLVTILAAAHIPNTVAKSISRQVTFLIHNFLYLSHSQDPID